MEQYGQTKTNGLWVDRWNAGFKPRDHFIDLDPLKLLGLWKPCWTTTNNL